MLANGRCTAPEAVVYSRVLVRDLTPADLTPGYPPAVRFYFRWRSLADHPCARFDGVHPVKILGGLRLDERLVAVVAPTSQRRLITANAGPFLDRVAFVDIERPSPQDWAVAALTAARVQQRNLRAAGGHVVGPVGPALEERPASYPSRSPVRTRRRELPR